MNEAIGFGTGCCISISKFKPHNMDFSVHHPTNSPSSSSSSTTSSSTPHPTTTTATTTSEHDPMQSWWESVSKARSRILNLSSILSSSTTNDPSSSSSFSLSSLADSDRPALSLLSSPQAYSLLSSSLSSPSAGSGSDPLCHWLYDTYVSSDPHLRLIVLSFLPLLSALYLARIHSNETSTIPSLSGFEAVILAIYTSEAKSRAGKALLVQIPDLSQPSLYHTPRTKPSSPIKENNSKSRPSVGVLSPPLEPQIAVKSTKRASILGTAFDCYYKQISQMPSWSKIEFCRFAGEWAGQDCECQNKLDSDGEFDDVLEKMERFGMEENGETNGEIKGVRIPLPWELLQPVLRILGHCLLGPLNPQDVKDAASVAVRRLYARVSHDLVPQAIIGTRSLIQLDKRERAAAKANAAAAAAANASSNANTPTKAKKPEILLASK